MGRAELEGFLVRHLPPRAVYALAERRYASQEPELRFVPHLVDPRRDAVDVGAWLGPWTRALARTARHVHAFEPQPRLAAHLRRVVADNVTVHEAAVGDEAGTATLLVDDRPGRDALARLAATAAEGPDGSQRVEVPVVRLDDVGLGDVGFVKIDVEGHEASALRGAERLLERCHPTIVLEAEQRHLDHPVTDLFAWLLARGWTGWFLGEGRWQSLDGFDVERDQTRWLHDVRSASYVNNFLFLPSGVEVPGPLS